MVHSCSHSTADSCGWRSPRSRARRSSDLRTATGLRITPIGFGSRSRQSSRSRSIRGSLTPIVRPEIVPRISSRLLKSPRSRRGSSGGFHHEPPFRSRIELCRRLRSLISRLPRALKRACSETGPSSTPCSWSIPAVAEVPLRCMPSTATTVLRRSALIGFNLAPERPRRRGHAHRAAHPVRLDSAAARVRSR